MSAQTQVPVPALNSPGQTMSERKAWYLPGVPMLDLVPPAAAAAGTVRMACQRPDEENVVELDARQVVNTGSLSS